MTTQLPLPPELNPRGRGRRGRHGTTATSTRAAGVLRYGRALSWVAIVAAGLVLLGSGSLWAYVSYLGGKIHNIGALCVADDCNQRPQEKGSTENFLLVGSDTRSGDNSTGALAGLANGSGGNGLSDSTMLVHLSSGTDHVTVISFPRDMLVQMPGYTDSQGTRHDPSAQKFNAAYSYGGPRLLVKQVENLTGLRVDHYVGIDFNGFINIVNALGGIDVCITSVPGSTTNLHDPGAPSEGTAGSGFSGKVGINHLSGFHALQYVRQRHGLPQGDLDRIQRQHRFLAAVFAKVQSAGTLLNPLKLNKVLSAAASDLSKDSGTRTDDLITLAQKMHDLSGNSVEYFTVPTVFGPQISGLGSVLYPVKDQARALFQAVYDDQDPAKPAPKPTTTKKPSASASASAGPVVTIPPSNITVNVLNGSGQAGQAGTVSSALRGVGFTIGTVGDAPTSTTTTTEIHYGSNRADSVKTVAAALPGATTIADPSLSANTIEVITGSDYSGVKTVTVSGAPTTGATTSTAPPSPSAAPTVSADVTGGKQTGNKDTGTAGISIAGGCGP